MTLQDIENKRSEIKREDDLRRAEYRWKAAGERLERARIQLSEAVREEELACRNLERVRLKQATNTKETPNPTRLTGRWMK